MRVLHIIKAKKVDNSQIVIKRYNYAHKNKYKAVGRVSNMDGWKGQAKIVWEQDLW